jgi:inosine-uridine nucleoside N-ribohydrolase
MGGYFILLHRKSCSEANIEGDPDAADIVLTARNSMIRPNVTTMVKLMTIYYSNKKQE